ncbi:S24/S26 family peptidase [Deltaproteobacteria bacterium OttesenSCG-928-K17]|nr:S24/S26 family peptidase [Deltaproteobacteria bacterium OttesenSCG-928-K17]
MDIKRLTQFFAAALQAEMARQPRGARKKIAEAAEVSASLITDITNGRKYGSEESRRMLARSLGWEYEEFLRYGECLLEGAEYKRPELPEPAYDPAQYLAVPLHRRIAQIKMPDGKAFIPDPDEHNDPMILLRESLGPYNRHQTLAAFAMPDQNMEPTILKGSLIVVDTNDHLCQDQKIYLISTDNQADSFTARRMSLKGGDSEVIFLSDNSKYPAGISKHPWRNIVIGRVVFVFSVFI